MADNGIVEREIAESVVPVHRLGRHVMRDARSRNYQASMATKVTSATHVATGRSSSIRGSSMRVP